MTLDLAKIKSDAEVIASRCDTLLMPLPVKDVLAMVRKIEGLFEQHGRDSGELRKLCSARDSARRQRDQLKAENEALRKQIADLSPFKNATLKDFRASNKCLACGEYHHGLSGLPCPKMTPVAQAFAGSNQRVVPVEPIRIPHPFDDFGKELP